MVQAPVWSFMDLVVSFRIGVRLSATLCFWASLSELPRNQRPPRVFGF